MTNIEMKIKKWIELIQTEKLSGLPEDIQANVLAKNDKVNKQIFKLLLYLSHTADKCDKRNQTMGMEIYKLTCTLCTILTDIPDNNKFVCSLFHIINCLLMMYMFDQAYKVCFYLKTEALYYSHEYVSDILVKIAHLWYNVTNTEFLVLQKSLSNTEQYLQLKNIIKYELEVIQIVHKNPTKQLLTRTSTYLDKIVSTSKNPNVCFFDFSAFIVECLSQTKMHLNSDEKYTVCRHMLHITNTIICGSINDEYLKSAMKILNTIKDHFKKVLSQDEECYQSFMAFEFLCDALAKPIECLVENDVKQVQQMTDIYIKLTGKYGYTGSVKWITFSIIQILDPLFVYWDTCIKTGRKIYLRNDLLLEIMKLVGHTSMCFIKQTLDKCTSCQNEECTIRKNIYNAVVIKIICMNFIIKLSTDDLSRDIYRLAKKFLEQNIELIMEMKNNKCKCWTQVWSATSALIYNFSIMYDSFQEESLSLISLLFTSTVRFNVSQLKSHCGRQNSVCFILHRISSYYYNHGLYREAMTAVALNALLSYNDSESKAFRTWANIKHKSVASKEIMEMTILACLKRDKPMFKELGLSIELLKYDLVEICLREVKGLQDAKVNLSTAIHKVLSEMKVLNATAIQYARAVQMLVFHLLHFDYDEDLDCLKQALANLKQVKTDSSILCLQANLEFYMFVTHLHAMNKKTRMEMENTKFALHALKVNVIEETESPDVVPAYSMINIKEDFRLMKYFQLPLKKWSKCFKQNLKEIAKGHESIVTLHTLIIAGEYARLYRYEECEVDIWKFVYALASELKNNFAIIYVTGRCIALRHINDEWITTAKKLAIKLKDTSDDDTIYAIAIFWISLSDFYFECNMYDEARKLLNESAKLPGISFFNNIAVYLYRLDRILYNCHLYKETMEHKEYTRYIVETLYTLVNLNEELSERRWNPQDKHLLGFDMLFSATVNLSLRMNSLLSFREIGAHLVRRLKTAQALGATMRVAEILKSLCYIDLSRIQLNDCEVKLQGLEYILNIESFKASMNCSNIKNNSENVLSTPIRVIDPIRDVPQNDTSPVLRNKVFDLPEFMCHNNCSCYFCQNVSYHYLVFTSTHIRAQLYALQENIAASLQHFNGAFKIKEKLMKTEKYKLKCNDAYVSWQERFYSIDYVLLLINFSYFWRNYLNKREEKLVSMILLVSRICEMYKLNGHPIYMAAKELMLDYHFQKIFDSSDYSKFTVPDVSSIDTSKYEHESNVEGSICVTPNVSNPRTKKPVTLQRNRTPPLLKLTKVNIEFSDEEDNVPSPPARQKMTRSRGRLTRRKLLEEEYSDPVSQMKEISKQSNTNLSLEELNDMKENNSIISIKDMIKKITLLAPDISEYLSKTVDEVDEPITTKNVQKLIDTVESLKANVASGKKTKKTRSLKLHSGDCDKINQVIMLFKDFEINEGKNNSNVINKNDVTPERDEKSVTSVMANPLTCHEQNKINEENSIEKLQQNNLDNLKKTSTSESSSLRITRKSAKQTILNKETHSAKSKKLKKK
ncbi:uncharacterized protein LOC143429594 [Xylocopa sonorina]|uniref:uncharacterized protein LOC143429594 n=1 Tax=Xylocopa sonorina TaxID=1818115 RepID=UPI00403B101D